MADSRVRSLTNSEKKVRAVLLALQEIGAIPSESEVFIDLGRIVSLGTRDGSSGKVASDQVRERRGIHVAGSKWDVWVTLSSSMYVRDGDTEHESTNMLWSVTYLKVEVEDHRIFPYRTVFQSHHKDSIFFLLSLSKSFRAG